MYAYVYRLPISQFPLQQPVFLFTMGFSSQDQPRSVPVPSERRGLGTLMAAEMGKAMEKNHPDDPNMRM